jgi:hypothetical protein
MDEKARTVNGVLRKSERPEEEIAKMRKEAREAVRSVRESSHGTAMTLELRKQCSSKIYGVTLSM